jgi:hypothetical protein
LAMTCDNFSDQIDGKSVTELSFAANAPFRAGIFACVERGEER